MWVITLLLYGALVLVLGVLGILLGVYFQIKQNAKYFSEKGIPFYSKGFSNLILMLRGKTTAPEVEFDMYREAKKTGKPLFGVSNATGAQFYVSDLELMKNIYVKDFDHFMNRRQLTTVDSDMFSKMLISLKGERWKELRSKLSPAFTAGKIRRMYGIFERSSEKMCDFLEKIVGPGGDIDMCQVYSKFAMDVIASCAFGVQSNCFEYNSNDSELETMGRGFQLRFTPGMFARLMFITFFPRAAKHMGVQPFDPEPQQYFTKLIRQVIQTRRETGEKKEDFLQLMMDAQEGLFKNEEGSKESLEVMTGASKEMGQGQLKGIFGVEDKLKLDDDMIIANCELFLLAGFDTMQSLLIYSALALAREQDVQERLRKEVEDAYEENGDTLSYEAINQMTYLDMFINETLRYYASSTRAERVCTKDYKVPGTDWVIEKGRIVVMPIYALHHDEEYYENPNKFEPERFQPEKKRERHPYSFAPFGYGPRNCIGMRFALIEVKTLIAHLVLRFKLEPCEKTDIPPKFANNLNLKPANGMWLRISTLQGCPIGA